MITLSLAINIVVLIPVCLGLLLGRPEFDGVFGPRTTAREILVSIYLAILLMSAWLLFDSQNQANFVVSLLALQVAYKILSVVLISNKKAPVLWFNLVIAVIHTCTLVLIFSRA